MAEANENGWGEYKQLFLADRDQNREDHAKIFEQLGQIQTTLAEMRGAKTRKQNFLNVSIPAVVSFIVMVIPLIVKHFWK